MTHPRPTAPAPARPSPDDVKRRLAEELGLPSRLGHALLLLVGLAGAGVTVALLITEPALPARTRVALAALAAIGLAWAAFSAWVLARRRVLLAAHRVVAGRMAVAFCLAFTLGALLLRRIEAPGGPWTVAAAVGGAMLAVAGAVLVRAHHRRAALARRLAEIERALASTDGVAR